MDAVSDARYVGRITHRNASDVYNQECANCPLFSSFLDHMALSNGIFSVQDEFILERVHNVCERHIPGSLERYFRICDLMDRIEYVYDIAGPEATRDYLSGVLKMAGISSSEKSVLLGLFDRGFSEQGTSEQLGDSL
jgi:hypothetical protein